MSALGGVSATPTTSLKTPRCGASRLPHKPPGQALSMGTSPSSISPAPSVTWGEPFLLPHCLKYSQSVRGWAHASSEGQGINWEQQANPLGTRGPIYRVLWNNKMQRGLLALWDLPRPARQGSRDTHICKGQWGGQVR